MADVDAGHGVRARADAFQVWLETRPPQVAAVLAVRAGLRVLPFVVAEPVGGRFSPMAEREILSAFRHAALGRLSTKRPSGSLTAFATLLNTIAYGQMTGATSTIQVASRTASLIGSAFSTWKDTALRAAYAVMCSASSSDGPPLDALAIDQAWIEAGDDPMVLLDEPVWLGLARSPPVPNPNLSRWEATRATLEDADPSWRVWTHWYDGRLRGEPAGPDDAELVRLTLFPDATTRMADASWDGLQRWKADLETNRSLLKGSPRRSNRVVARLLGGIVDVPSDGSGGGSPLGSVRVVARREGAPKTTECRRQTGRIRRIEALAGRRARRRWLDPSTDGDHRRGRTVSWCSTPRRSRPAQIGAVRAVPPERVTRLSHQPDDVASSVRAAKGGRSPHPGIPCHGCPTGIG